MNTSLSIALILFVGIACQYLSWRIRVPAILFLLSVGILAGPVLGWLHPDLLFGELLFPLVSLSIAVILFEGSLTLKLRDIPGLEKMIRNMITFGALITWVLAALAARFFLHFSWELSCLFGALMVVTGPTVIMPMIRTIRPRENVANVLQWESILIDPLGAILVVLVYQFIVAGGGVPGGMLAGLTTFARILVVGLGLGSGGGFLLGSIIRRYWAPKYLHNVIVLAMVCLVFALSNALEGESGLLAVTVMGIWLANMKGVDLKDILGFKESLSLILVSLLFIVLAARLELAALLRILWPALGVFAVIQFLARPLSIQLCSIGSKLGRNERHLLAWIAPRGIVAAAVSALFAERLGRLGYEHAAELVPLTFVVIIATVLLQSASARPIARLLRVTEPEPRGVLIIGANPLARMMAQALQKNGFPVLLTDQDWFLAQDARMQGLDVYWGNPMSEHAEQHLHLAGFGQMVALSPNPELNALATQSFRLEFESRNIHSIANAPEPGTLPRTSAFRHGGRPLFNGEHTCQKLEQALKQGARLHTTQLSEKFSYKDYLQAHIGQWILLFAVDEKERLHFFATGDPPALQPGWRIAALEPGACKQDKETGFPEHKAV